ncbi:Breakpoint cluster region protein [Larimichthys crocea]|uniref:Uncharacterized protein n=1 Tax=Larimichthys crocea TaxID=215358 RepID=A0ACD3QMB3_LARCR|nr:Breakpoint cluster region protein [Larimichthys crocea]
MMGEGGGGDGRSGGSSGGGGVGGVTMRDLGGGDDHLLTWPRRSYSPGSFEDVGGGGGYTPDCSSNENLTSSEEDFSSGQSSHVSPSPTTAFRRPFREKSRSPSQNSQNSQHSFDSSSPPTPQSQKRHHRQQGGHVVMSEATIVSVRKTGQIWPPAAHHDLLPHGRTSHDNSFHGDHLDGHFTGTPPTYGYDADRAEEQRRHHDILPYIDDSPSSSPHLSSKSRSSRDTLSSGSLESSKSPMKPLKAAATTSQPVLTVAQIETIFFKVPELYEIHREFYDGLFPPRPAVEPPPESRGPLPKTGEEKKEIIQGGWFGASEVVACASVPMTAETSMSVAA